jgi:hypothetical protein
MTARPVRAAGCTKPGLCVMWFLAIVAGIVFVIAAGLLAGRARRAGHPALGSFTDSASLPVSAAFFWAALGLALHHHLDWTTPAVFLLACLAWTVWRALRHRRNNA